MSCSNCNCSPCQCTGDCDPASEPLSSALDNFISAFFGAVTKSCVNNQVVWTLPCDLASGMAFYPRQANEGLACYFLRIFDLFGIVASGVWSTNTLYPKNAFVTFNGQGYVSLTSTIGQQPDLFPGSWQLYIAQGAVGPPGASPLTTKGDVFGFDVADARIPVGADNTALMADSTQALGVRWGFPPSADLASNLGAGNGVFASKAGNVFQFKSLIAGSGITITPTANDLTISTSGAGGITAGFVSAQQVITSAGGLTLAHGLGSTPTLAQVRLICLVAEHEYSIGDELFVPFYITVAGTNTGVAIVPDATNLNIRYGNGALTFNILTKTTGVFAAITNASWNAIFRAWV